jgi:hypothetical protein
VPVTAGGWVDPAGVAEAIGPDTQLVSIMHVNNETGVIQDAQAIGATCRDRGVLFHVDAAQSAGKVPLDLKSAPIDLCSLTAHKLCGPKGVGALYVAPRATLVPQLHGGEQERSLRAGALATHQVVGIGKAYELAEPEREAPRYAALRDIASIEEARSCATPNAQRPTHKADNCGRPFIRWRFALSRARIQNRYCAPHGPRVIRWKKSMVIREYLSNSVLSSALHAGSLHRCGVRGHSAHTRYPSASRLRTNSFAIG